MASFIYHRVQNGNVVDEDQLQAIDRSLVHILAELKQVHASLTLQAEVSVYEDYQAMKEGGGWRDICEIWHIYLLNCTLCFTESIN